MRKGIRTQLVLPLLETLREAGGRAKPADVYESVADKLGLTDEERAETFAWRGRELNAFNRHVRWARQTALLKGLLAAPERGVWELTDVGGDRLLNCRRGVVLTVFTTPSGAALWSTAESALGVIEDGSVDLLFSSPPYVGAMAKEYGEFDEAYWLDFMSDLAGEWRKKLAPTGSIMLNLGSTYEPKRPTVSPYIERFTLRMIDQHRFHLLDRLYWDNTNRLPSPFHWVAMRRVRLKPSVEPILWFGATPDVKADNRNVLQPYGAWMQRRLARAAAGEAVTLPGGERPSGHRFGKTSFTRDNGGAIAPTVIRACAGGPEQRRYAKACRGDGLPAHGATMPAEVAEFCIKFATEEGDLVYDPFGGSLTTGAVAERLGRRWIANDRSLAYLAGARHRFPTIDACGPILADALGAFRRAA